MSPTLQDKPPSKPRNRKPAPRSKKREPAAAPKLSRTDPEPISDVMAAAGPDDVGANDEIALAATVVSAMNEAPPEQETESACDAAAVVVEAAPLPEATAAFGETSQAHALRPDHDAAPVAHAPPPASADQAGGQTIGDQYKNYVSGSVRRAGFLFEKMMAARSLSQAMEVQAEFAKQPCANVFEGAEIAFKLYGDFTKRILTTWQRNAPDKAVD